MVLSMPATVRRPEPPCRDEDLETAQFTHAEAQSELARLREQADSAKVAAAEAEQTCARAVAALDGVKAEAAKATLNAERHQEVSLRPSSGCVQAGRR